MSENNPPCELTQDQAHLIYNLNVKFSEAKKLFESIKNLYIKAHDLGNGTSEQGKYNGEGAREVAIAVTNLEQAFMWADRACKFTV